jgi:hypothetical protein
MYIGPFVPLNVIKHMESRPSSVQAYSVACLCYQWQVVEIQTQKQGNSILILELEASRQGYAYFTQKHWNQCGSIASIGLGDSLSSLHQHAGECLLQHLNRSENQRQLARLFAQCETRRKQREQHASYTLAYLRPMLATLPEALKIILAENLAPDELALRLSRISPSQLERPQRVPFYW